MLSPIIIVGMHRSGTSMLTRIMQEGGINIGKKLDINSESIRFINLHDWLLFNLKMSWDSCFDLDKITSQQRKFIFDVLSSNSSSYHILRHLGSVEYIKSLAIKGYRWGWKDPRTSLFINEWSQVYPDAKFIHIYRHPIDVANSLSLRSKQFKVRYGKVSRLKKFFAKGNVFGQYSSKVLSLDYGIKLWDVYSKSVFDYSGDNILHIKYEDLVLNKSEIFGQISTFINDVEARSIDLKVSGSELDSSRAFSYLREIDKSSRAVLEKQCAQLSSFQKAGY